MSQNLRLTKLMVLRGLRARTRLSQLLAAKQEEQVQIAARDKAVAAHRKAVADARDVMSTALHEAADIRDPAGRYAAVVNRMSQAQSSVEKALDDKFEADYRVEDAGLDVSDAKHAYAHAAREESKFETLTERQQRQRSQQNERRDEEAISDLVSAHPAWRIV